MTAGQGAGGGAHSPPACPSPPTTPGTWAANAVSRAGCRLTSAWPGPQACCGQATRHKGQPSLSDGPRDPLGSASLLVSRGGPVGGGGVAPPVSLLPPGSRPSLQQVGVADPRGYSPAVPGGGRDCPLPSWVPPSRGVSPHVCCPGWWAGCCQQAGFSQTLSLHRGAARGGTGALEPRVPAHALQILLSL